MAHTTSVLFLGASIGLLTRHAAAQPSYEALCPPGMELDASRSTCDAEMLVGVAAYLQSSTLTQQECDAVVDASRGTQLKEALLWAQATCCSASASRPIDGQAVRPLCPSFFPADGTVCMDAAHFKPFAAMGGMFHCMGDEAIMDERTCARAGAAAWDPNAEEKCDVGRVQVDDSEKAKLCRMVGGVWEEYSCMMMQMWFQQEGVFDTFMSNKQAICSNMDIAAVFPMVGMSCCKNDDGATLAPAKELICPGMPGPMPSPMPSPDMRSPMPPSPMPTTGGGGGGCAPMSQDVERGFVNMGFRPKYCH